MCSRRLKNHGRSAVEAAARFDAIVRAKDALLREAEAEAEAAAGGNDGSDGGHGLVDVASAIASESLELGEDELDAFAGVPLGGGGGGAGGAAVDLARFVTSTTRAERGEPPVDAALCFDVGAHPQAGSEVAKSMTARLVTDARVHAERSNAAREPRLAFVRDEVCNDVSHKDLVACPLRSNCQPTRTSTPSA